LQNYRATTKTIVINDLICRFFEQLVFVLNVHLPLRQFSQNLGHSYPCCRINPPKANQWFFQVTKATS
jgi:hypothetical protein